MNIARYLADIIVRMLAICVKSKAKRRSFRETGFAKIDKYFDFIKHLRMRDSFLVSQQGPTVLLVTHELSITGAPMVLLEAAKILCNQNFSVFLVSFCDGPLRVEFEKLGIRIVIGRLYKSDPDSIRRISHGFDIILANTVMCALWIKHTSLPSERIIWWLHESEGISRLVQENPQVFEEALIAASNVYVVSEYARRFVEKYCSPGIINLGISDNFDAEDRVGAVSDLHKTSIAVVGTFCHRKNQELVFKALKLMSASSLAKLELIFVGQKKGRYYKSLIRVLKNEKLPVFFTGEILDITEKWRLFADIDIFCVPSRDESCSLVVLEAFMLAKPVVISDKVGARYLVEPGKNGFIFQNDNAESLKNILEYLIEEPRLLAELGQSARDTYLEKATLEQFATRFIQVVDSVLLV